MIKGFKIPFLDIYIVKGKSLRSGNNEIETLESEISKMKNSSALWNQVYLNQSKRLDFVKSRLKRYEG